MKKSERLRLQRNVVNHRKRQRAAGRAFVYLNLPATVVQELDLMKKDRRLRSRSAAAEIALAYFLEKRQQSEHQPKA
jgi:metal-responsive CopG/Arc/MetJ family transcriptional regulator